MSGGGGFIGDIVGGVGDIVGGAGKVVEKALDYSGKLVDKTVGTVADLAKNIDIEDAAKTLKKKAEDVKCIIKEFKLSLRKKKMNNCLIYILNHDKKKKHFNYWLNILIIG